ncbi:MAG: gyrA [Rickettsiales bacterium]|nr:gyrA [Rickettsiales bacterium]
MSTNQTAEILPITIEQEMKNSYLDYAMSVIVSRAIPDARDGLKPVHRRILHAMNESGCDWNRPFKKSARIVGEVMGKYHPHGDSAIYDSLVRMAQDFSLRLPLIDGQGNFGSMDGDSPAAMRYTESRLAKSAHKLLDDIDKDTVSFQPNYDGSEREPIVLPARFPNLLVNGAGGIAVGMATNIPTFNLGEVIDATCAILDNAGITAEELLEIIPGPDFPTGGVILGRTGSATAVTSGRGSVIIRGKAEIEDIANDRQAIIITEIPYQVNKAKMIERFAELVREKRIEGVGDLRDESDKSGVRVVVELKRGANAEVVLNQLYSYSPLQTSFGVNMLALDLGRPRLMNVKEVLESFINFRDEVITRRTHFLLTKAREKAHILIGLAMAVANIDEVIKIIRSSPDSTEARTRLMERDWPAEDVSPLIALVADNNNKVINGRCYFTEAQARAILEMRLARLTGLEKEKIDGELKELAAEISDYLDILGSRERLYGILRQELIEVKQEFATPRRTVFEANEFEADIEDLIAKEDMVVTVTMAGYIKRVPLSTYRAQRRGGKGRSGMAIRDEDITTKVYVVNTHTPVLFFSNIGKVYKLKVYKLPLGNPQSKGRALVNIFPLASNETITNIMPMPEDENTWDNLSMLFASSQGNIRRSDMADFKRVQSNGKIAIRLDDSDALVGVRAASDDQHILLAAKNGKSIRFPVTGLRVIKSRTSDGVRGMTLEGDDRVISMTVLEGREVDIETREKYLRIPVELRAKISDLLSQDELDQATLDTVFKEVQTELSREIVQNLAKGEQFLLTLTENGYGKRTSSYEYRITNRGGKGIVNIVTSARNGNVLASMPVFETDQIMLITDKGKIIRTPVHDIRIAGRNTQGVTIFRTASDEKVVSATRVKANAQEEDATDDLEGAEG